LEDVEEAWYWFEIGTVLVSELPSQLKLILQLSKVAAERCAEARRTFAMEIGNEPPERVVCADESAVNILTSYRDNGWAFKGVRARKRAHFVRGTRFVILTLLSLFCIGY
jgi:hypothetical protein